MHYIYTWLCSVADARLEFDLIGEQQTFHRRLFQSPEKAKSLILVFA